MGRGLKEVGGDVGARRVPEHLMLHVVLACAAPAQARHASRHAAQGRRTGAAQLRRLLDANGFKRDRTLRSPKKSGEGEHRQAPSAGGRWGRRSQTRPRRVHSCAAPGSCAPCVQLISAGAATTGYLSTPVNAGQRGWSYIGPGPAFHALPEAAVEAFSDLPRSRRLSVRARGGWRPPPQRRRGRGAGGQRWGARGAQGGAGQGGANCGGRGHLGRDVGEEECLVLGGLVKLDRGGSDEVAAVEAGARVVLKGRTEMRRVRPVLCKVGVLPRGPALPKPTAQSTLSASIGAHNPPRNPPSMRRSQPAAQSTLNASFGAHNGLSTHPRQSLSASGRCGVARLPWAIRAGRAAGPPCERW